MPGALVTLFINICMLIWMTLGAPRAIDVAMADMMVMIVWLLGLVVGLVRLSDMPGAPEELVHPAKLSSQGEGRGVAVWAVCGVAL